MMDLQDFLSEARECVETASNTLLSLESAPDANAINAVFRAFHTLKGNSGFFGLGPLTRLVHAAEDLLATMRNGSRKVDAKITDELLSTVDLVERWLDALAATGQLPADADQKGEALARTLHDLCTSEEAPEYVLFDTTTTVPTASLAPALSAAAESSPAILHHVRYTPGPSAFYAGVDPLRVMLDIPGLLALETFAPPDGWPALAELDPRLCALTFEAVTQASEETLAESLEFVADRCVVTKIERPASAEAPAPQPAVPPPAAAAHAPVVAVPASPAAATTEAAPQHKVRGATTLRVAPEKLDTLLNLVGELVVAKNGLHYLARSTAEEAMARSLGEQHAIFDRLAEALQGAVMQLRMMPVGNIFQRFPRLVRDLGKDLGKNVVLNFEGEDTEADRTVIDRLSEPLTHLVRNSLDHGIEGPEDRVARGKSPIGTLTLSAVREADRLVIAITDDGRGVDVARVRSRAVERGLLEADQAAALSDDAVVDLIFAPGFSTAESISNVSGRGVGMDAVKRDVEALGGQVRTQNRPGQGMRVELFVPIAMAFSRVLVVCAAGERFGIPFDLVEGVSKVRRGALRTAGGGALFKWRDGLVPVLELESALGLASDGGSPDDVRALLVARLEGELVALAVDAFEADLDVVVKPASGPLAAIGAVAGTAILGDGRVLLVLDPKEVLACRRDAMKAA